ncbi:flippase [Acaryochloris sp. IP29b_bin.137]|uniref:flippase n=1 Tax=Acaryochloris sp. IP29b_bin.137 TaxID=2969217 RepID=UPI00260F435D|nr:flippase [Acaryochloris sp. IP29b_bin.137]
MQILTKLKHSDNLRKIIANTGWLFADRILRMGVGIIVTVWIARYLGVEQFGLLNYATTFVALFSPLASLGLDEIVIKEIVSNPSRKEEILGTTFWLKFISAIVCLLLTVSCIFGFRHGDTLIISLVTILAASNIFQAFNIISLWFQSQIQSKYTVISKNTVFVVITIFKVILIIKKAPLIAFAWATSMEFIVSALGLAIVYRAKGFSMRRWRWNFPMAKSLIRESFPLIFSGISIMIYMKIDQIMLGEMVGDTAVGIYSAATRISEVWYFIPMAIASSISPSFYEKKNINKALYYKQIMQLHRLLVLVSLAIALPMTFLSGKVIVLFFSHDYAEAGNVLAIHIWATIFVFMGVATSSWFIAEGLTKFSMYRTVAGGIANVILNLLLIPRYASIGAAIATVISYSVAGFFIHAAHSRTRKIFQIQLQSLGIKMLK